MLWHDLLGLGLYGRVLLPEGLWWYLPPACHLTRAGWSLPCRAWPFLYWHLPTDLS